MKFLVLGIGNTVMTDDAAGSLLARELSEKYKDAHPDMQIIEGGTLGLDLLPFIEWCDKLVLIDAVDLGLPAGTVVKIESDDIESTMENKLSPHQMGMKDLLATADYAGYRPQDATLYGIQVKCYEMSMELTPEVEAGYGKLRSHVEAEITSFLESAKA